MGQIKGLERGATLNESEFSFFSGKVKWITDRKTTVYTDIVTAVNTWWVNMFIPGLCSICSCPSFKESMTCIIPQHKYCILVQLQKSG